MFFLLINLVILLIASILFSLKQIQLGLLHAFTYTSKLAMRSGEEQSSMAKYFPFMNFSCIFSNIPATPANGVYISQLIRYSRASGSYQDSVDRGVLLTRKILNQRFQVVKLKALRLTSILIHLIAK